MKERLKSFLGIGVILGFFVFFSYIIQENLDFFESYLGNDLGMIIFVLILALSIVFSMISAIPLFPVSSALWGVTATAILGVIGWTIGAVVAFLIARKYGVNLVKRVIPLDQLYKFEKKIPQKNLFFTVVFIRAVLPIDGLSYILGLFSKMSLKSYTFATILGLIPFCFVFAYLGSVPLTYQIVFSVLSIFFLLIGFVIANYRHCFKKGRNDK